MDNTALIIVDVQKGLDEPSWGVRNNPDAEQKIVALLAQWRDKGRPVVHIQHCSVEPDSPLRPDRPGCEFKDEVTPVAGEAHFKKSVNSAFIGTGLEDYLRDRDISSLVIVGLTTDHCVSTTTRMAGNLGFDVTLVSDATATFDRAGHDGVHHSAESIHDIHLASLNDEFCLVRSTEDVLSSSGS
ncbi:MAG: cysteine hydrolase family protein [Woeseiaceae bacterium]|nr:cysteine hydrolase family protein [Woeseiaceae bacterium]